MDSTLQVKRTVLYLTFSREFEALLLSYPTAHSSLTHDLELAVERGLERLIELEDVRELKHQALISYLISHTNRYSVMSSNHFEQWSIALREDLLDEVELMLLSHGKDLVELGLYAHTPSALILLLAVAGLR